MVKISTFFAFDSFLVFWRSLLSSFALHVIISNRGDKRASPVCELKEGQSTKKQKWLKFLNQLPN